MVLFTVPWLLVPLFRPGLESYLIAAGGLILGIVLGLAADVLLRRRLDDAIHERGALLRVEGAREILWFSPETLVTEIHEIVREFGEPDEDQWVFEVRTGGRTFALSTYLPRSATRIRSALTAALGRPPRIIERR